MSEIPSELFEVLLDDEQLGQYFSDLAAHAEVSGVLVKGQSLQRSSREPVPLAEAQRLLCAADVFGIQIRYRRQDRFWCDTLLREKAGVRVVRMDATA